MCLNKLKSRIWVEYINKIKEFICYLKKIYFNKIKLMCYFFLILSIFIFL